MKDIQADENLDILSIGSFRNDIDIQKYLPEQLHYAIFGDIPDNLDIENLITLKSRKINFNNGAFGNSYDDVNKLSLMLRAYSEENPEIFYDQMCLPLINHTYYIAEEFFQTEKVLLVPNCTFGMRCVAESLIRDFGHTSIACLYPIYGATLKLLNYFESRNLIEPVLKVAPGENPLIEEEGAVIIAALDDAYNLKPFTVLFCDQVASQSGRILQLEDVLKFCERRNVELVVDGTQSCSVFFGSKVNVLQRVDYFVMSTHKWLGNAKTCGIVLYKNRAPTPPAISFGWDEDVNPRDNIKKVRAQYMWQGMSDSYISYITLAKALKIFIKYGEEQFFRSSRLLQEGLEKHLHVKTLLPRNKDRIMSIFNLEQAHLVPLNDINKIQQALQNLGIFVSVKRFDKDCSGITVDGQLLKNSKLRASESGNNNNNNNQQCSFKPTSKYYLRLSCWSYNTQKDFEDMALLMRNNSPLSNTTSEGLKQKFLFSFDIYEKLFSVLMTKAFFIRAEKLRHHLIFYYGHTAVFYTNKLVAAGILHPSYRFDARLESSLSVGVDEMSWDDLLEENYDWSGLNDGELKKFLDKVQEYRNWVRKLVLRLLDQNPAEHPIAMGSAHWVILMGIEHENIHLETSAVIISQVPVELIKKKHKFNYPTFWKDQPKQVCRDPSEVPKNQLVKIPGGTVYMGKDNLEGDLYGWDNEYGSEKKTLHAFEVSQMLVSNAEFLQFVKEGGYQKEGKKWWSKEGWKYVTELNVTTPRFWEGLTHYRALLEVIPMPWNLPVEVNNLEAEAFCNWKSSKLGKKLRLLSFEESFLMRSISKQETKNMNLTSYASPTPVNFNFGLINGARVYDISGNIWRHSVSVLITMEGFRTDPLYNDFSLPCVDGFHNNILGGSWISMGNLANLNSRYAFRRHFYQYAGIRYVVSDNTYHDKVLKMYDEVKTTKFITEHYTDFTSDVLVEKKPVKNWPYLLGQKAAKVINTNKGDGSNKVLISHGGPGRATIEILRACSNLNIDHTDETANKLLVLESLLQDKRIQWYQQLEGKIFQPLEYHLAEGESSETLLRQKNNTVSFAQMDYRNMRPQFDNYDVIVVDLRRKRSAAELMHQTRRLKTGGLLILGSIDNTNEGVQHGESHSLAVLLKYFSRLNGDVEELPHMYRETKNKHQYAISYFSTWKKIGDVSVNDEENSKTQGDIPTSNDVTNTTDYYEDDNILMSYDSFHFGDSLLSVKNFPLRMSEVIIAACKKFDCPMKRALDAGCGPGRTAIELCEEFEFVEGYDFSHGFIKMMSEQKEKKKLQNLTCYQGDSHKQIEISRDKQFDMVFGCNLIDRLHSPELWVQQSKSMLSPNGLLIISSPYTWKAEHTAAEKWIGGFKKDGEDFFTVQGLQEMLSPELVLLEEVKVPFVIPDVDGTFQYTYSNCTVFGGPRS